MIRTYLIDPFTKAVREVERIASGRGSESLNDIYDLLHCHKVKAVAMPSVGTDAILVDEEGLHKVDQEFFRCMLWPQEVFGGRALWIGATPEGVDASPRTSLNYVRASILFEL